MKWVPTKERLPKNFDQYLITDGLDINVLYFDDKVQKFYMMLLEDKYFIGGITHWCNIPKFPKLKDFIGAGYNVSV